MLHFTHLLYINHCWLHCFNYFNFNSHSEWYQYLLWISKASVNSYSISSPTSSYNYIYLITKWDWELSELYFLALSLNTCFLNLFPIFWISETNWTSYISTQIFAHSVYLLMKEWKGENFMTLVSVLAGIMIPNNIIMTLS